jgi:MoxR-like ATPase
MAAFLRISETSVEPMFPLLLGEPGVGKNKLVYTLARICRRDLYIFQGSEDVADEDLICATRVSDDPDKKIDYILTPLTTAMVRGAIFYLDEIGKIRHKALAPLASLLEERCYIDSKVLGERIAAHASFRFLAGSNPDDFEREALPAFMQSRAKPVIPVGPLPRQEIEKILRSRYRYLSENGNALLRRFWDLWNEKNKDRGPTPRDSLQTFGYAIQLANLPDPESTAADFFEHQGIFQPVQEKHLDAAFERILGG